MLCSRTCSGGRLVKCIKPDKTAQFEGTIARLKEALERSDSPERRQQAATWKSSDNAPQIILSSVFHVTEMNE